MTKIKVSKNYYPELNIQKIEEKYNAKYLGDFCIKNKNKEYHDIPVACFYVENPDISKGHSNYFGIFTTDEKMLICNALSAFEDDFDGLLLDTGEILISCYRHHYNELNNNAIDGGRAYLRYTTNENSKLVKLKMINGNFKVL